jgi:hypothetical protein
MARLRAMEGRQAVAASALSIFAVTWSADSAKCSSSLRPVMATLQPFDPMSRMFTTRSARNRVGQPETVCDSIQLFTSISA